MNWMRFGAISLDVLMLVVLVYLLFKGSIIPDGGDGFMLMMLMAIVPAVNIVVIQMGKNQQSNQSLD